VIVREGDGGGTMYLVQRGRVVISVGADQRRVAATETGGYFGEMSLLTGDTRTATVTADGDCLLLEIAAADFRQYVQAHPAVLDQMASTAELRRKELADAKATASAAPEERVSLLQRMQRFFGIGA
jgi:CRP-like cAMP-binding protein